MTLVLSLFPGIGLLDMAFDQEGFCVVRGPDVLWGGDVRRFHPPAGVFAGVIGGPSCKIHSRLKRVNPKAGEKEGNLIPEFERCVLEAQPDWWLMENVPEAPEPHVDGYKTHCQVINNRWMGEAQNRKRRFSFGTRDGQLLFPETVALLNPQWEPAVTASGGMRATPVAFVRDGKGGHRLKTRLSNYGYATKRGFAEMLVLQGLPPAFLEDAPFTVEGKCEVVGNGVPLPMGLAVAKAIKTALVMRKA